MNDNISMQLRRPSKGRPPIDDRGEILLHFTTQLALGRSISEIAKAGLTFRGYRKKPDGSIEGPVDLRHLKGPTLERRYRRARAEVDLSIATATTSLAMVNARYIGISAPKTPQSFPPPRSVTRGRPKKIRQR